jgi:hypothetical protein
LAAGFCPYGCGCDETNSRVTCIRSDLEVRHLKRQPHERVFRPH